jgi:hypothetical protein
MSRDEPPSRRADRLLHPLAIHLHLGEQAPHRGGLLVVLYGSLLVNDAVIGGIHQERTGPLFYPFSSLVGGNFTLITIILSVSQLVISRQLGSPGELREQIQGTNAYREAIEETMELEVAPVTPSEFLHLLHRSSAELISQVYEKVDAVEEEPRDELLEITDRLDDRSMRSSRRCRIRTCRCSARSR